MKQKVLYTVVMIIVIIVFYYLEKGIDRGTYQNTDPEKIAEEYNNFLPSATNNAVVHHNNFSFSYREEHEQAEWIIYYLSADKLSAINRKRPYFEQDPFVATGSADWRNYKNSGYQRGHLCPAGDMQFDIDAYNETFYTSNIAPQKGNFNGGIWNGLEHKVRGIAKQKGKIIVVTGGVLSNNLKAIGYEQVSVPEYFYKIIFYPQEDYKALAFLIPQTGFSNDLHKYITTIDSIEARTGIDFFEAMDDQKELNFESTIDLDFWDL